MSRRRGPRKHPASALTLPIVRRCLSAGSRNSTTATSFEHRIFSEFEVVTLSEQHLEADVSGEIFDPARHTIFTEIKAVTFHDLQLERYERGWKAQIIFDL